MQTKTVLGLSLNSRMVAFAIMQGKTLVAYHSSLHKGIYNEAKRDRILTRLTSLLKSYTIHDLALVYPYEIHSTNNITHLLESIEAHFKSQNVPICIYNPEAFHLFCEEEERKTKKAMIESMCEWYPDLTPLYLKEQRNKSKYYVRLFEAVALAHIHSQSLR